MWWRPKQLQVRLSLLFVALLLGVSGFYVWLLMDPADQYAAGEIQRRSHELAASVVPLLHADDQTHAISEADLRQTFGANVSLNPADRRYLLGLDGRLLRASAPPPGEVRLARVPLAPIRAFLGLRAALPIWGVDPRQPAMPTLFSAALLRTRAGVPYGYLYITVGWRLAAAEPAASRQSYLLLGTLALAVVSVLVIGLLISLLTGNLHRLSAAVRRLQSGDYAARVTGIRPGDELGELAAFNELAARTQQTVQALETNDRLRRELLANVSHDLRTPLTSIKGYVETILRKQTVLTPAEQQTYLFTVLNNANTLERLVAELFELSKLEARQLLPKPEPFAVGVLVQDVLSNLQPVAEARTVHLEAQHPPDLPFACADVGMVQRVLQNLLDNALHYTPAGGRVRVAVAAGQNTPNLRLEISDTGLGIAAADLPHVFERFYRAAPGRAKHQSGCGLGLAIARKMIELHGGELHVTSREGQGTCFAFELPVYNGQLVIG